jgi:hypothetical protein
MDNFLKVYRSKDANESNFFSLKGGKWNIPNEKLDEFYEIYKNTFHNTKYYFVERKMSDVYRLFFDIDINKEEVNDLELMLIRLRESIEKVVCISSEFWCVSKRECGNKLGYHIIIPGYHVNMGGHYYLFDEIIKKDGKLVNYIDYHICSSKVGLRLYGSLKKDEEIGYQQCNDFGNREYSEIEFRSYFTINKMNDEIPELSCFCEYQSEHIETKQKSNKKMNKIDKISLLYNTIDVDEETKIINGVLFMPNDDNWAKLLHFYLGENIISIGEGKGQLYIWTGNHIWSNKDVYSNVVYLISNVLIKEILQPKFVSILSSDETLLKDDWKKLMLKIGNNGFINNLIDYYQKLYKCNDILPWIWNSKPIVAFTNGVYDSTTGFRNGLREDYLTMSTGYEYTDIVNEDIQYRILKTFKDSLMSNEEEYCVLEYLLVFMAKSLFGNKQQKFIIELGKGANGKSLTNQFLLNVFGHYGHLADPTLLTGERGKSNQACPEIVSLEHKRFVYAEEPERTKFNTSKIKELTGLHKVRGRNLYENDRDIYLNANFLMSCNQVPDLKDTICGGVKRRFVFINFPYQFKYGGHVNFMSNERQADIHIENDFHTLEYIQQMALILIKMYESFPDYNFDKLPKPILETTTKQLEYNQKILLWFDNELQPSEKHIMMYNDWVHRYTLWCKTEQNYNIGQVAIDKAINILTNFRSEYFKEKYMIQGREYTNVIINKK